MPSFAVQRHVATQERVTELQIYISMPTKHRGVVTTGDHWKTKFVLKTQIFFILWKQCLVLVLFDYLQETLPAANLILLEI